MTQGDPTSPTIFNIIVDAVFLAVLEEVCSPLEAQNGIVCAAGDRNLVFYADDGMIARRDHEWVQYLLAVIVAMFQWMRMETNLEKQGNVL